MASPKEFFFIALTQYPKTEKGEKETESLRKHHFREDIKQQPEN